MDLIPPNNGALMQPDRLGVIVRLKDPSYHDDQGNLVIMAEQCDWVVVYCVPQLMCTSCAHMVDKDLPATMCGQCIESWSWDWEFNGDNLDIDCVAWMLGRII